MRFKGSGDIMMVISGKVRAKYIFNYILLLTWAIYDRLIVGQLKIGINLLHKIIK